ncbi:hypothetical protein B5X24_HaOG216805 [Helicoverpa armigera]|nr:hypothetical protein B5X24_HaOG216805 [Helicoverpa armigera]
MIQCGTSLSNGCNFFEISWWAPGSSGRRLANRRMEERAIRNLFICDIGVGAGPPATRASDLGELKVGRLTSDYPNTHITPDRQSR